MSQRVFSTNNPFAHQEDRKSHRPPPLPPKPPLEVIQNHHTNYETLYNSGEHINTSTASLHKADNLDNQESRTPVIAITPAISQDDIAGTRYSSVNEVSNTNDDGSDEFQSENHVDDQEMQCSQGISENNSIASDSSVSMEDYLSTLPAPPLYTERSSKGELSVPNNMVIDLDVQRNSPPPEEDAPAYTELSTQSSTPIDASPASSNVLSGTTPPPVPLRPRVPQRSPNSSRTHRILAPPPLPRRPPATPTRRHH
mgnify:CR=1 FL=1